MGEERASGTAGGVHAVLAVISAWILRSQLSWARLGRNSQQVRAAARGWYARTRINEGDYILAINGKEVNLDENLSQYINDKQDREFEFLINSKPEKEGARTVKYKALTQDEWTDLNHRNRIYHLR